MKKTIFALLSLILACSLSAQQTPLYLLFNSSCMDQLEYRYVYEGTAVTAFSVHPTANEQYILTAGSGGINSPTLPANTVNCREYALNDQFLNDVNSVARQVYIVQQLTRGYMLIPVISATQILRSGTYYLFRAPSYSFAVDTSNLVYESNIATGTSTWYIYFNGLKIRSCNYEYSFKREPTKTNQERSEFDFIPGIGVSNERTGLTASEAEAHHLRLVRVNGMALEDYIAMQCRNMTSPTTAPLSQYTPQVNYGSMPARENDKELSSMQNNNTGANAGAVLPPPLANCPEQPGEGYHIVQPGETLNGISRAYDVSLKSLVSWNKIKDPDLILVCQKVWLKKPPVNSNSLAYKGVSERATTYSTPEKMVVRQDVYWGNTNNGATQPNPYSYNQPSTYSTGMQPYTTPQTYNNNQQPYTNPLTYNTTPQTYNTTPQSNAAPGQTLVHTVQKGETLYGIGLRYGLTESDMRRLNNYPPTGDVVLQPGMQLYVNNCCPNTNTYTQPANPATTYPAQSPQTYNTQPNPYTQPQTYNTQPANNGSFLPELYNNPTTGQPGAPSTYNYNTPANTPPVTQPAATPATTPSQPSYFQEYIVREGDTINSVAIKFKVSGQELALVNNKEPNETLIAGQRLLIPRN